ncbi:MAG: hypothetical protein EU532_10285 [Promethearchaeota archaeon]|nr:MAG: hypothetical protein EU532_10285 [Candidatus Lokiarchaeota archaeon]
MGQFLDFDKVNSIVYNNLYLEDYKLVVKIPIGENNYEESKTDVTIEKFDLTNRAFLLSIE